jgi:glucokinase
VFGEKVENRADSLTIGVDIGATKIAAALVTATGNVIASRHVQTRVDLGTENVFGRIANLVNELVQYATKGPNREFGSLIGLGIGVPGHVDLNAGVVRDAVNLGWDEVHLVEEIQMRLKKDLPIWISTDANACTLGEYYFGAARKCLDFVSMTIGSGLGVGIISHGNLVTGAHWIAADLGHLSINPEGSPCVCGLRGCAETIVSGPGLVRLVSEYLSEGEYTTQLFLESSEITPAMIVSAAQAGNDLALAAINQVGAGLGTVISNCLAILNPALIIIGGGLGLAAFDLITPSAWEEIKKRNIPPLYANLNIKPSTLTSSAVGAACLPLSHQRVTA